MMGVPVNRAWVRMMLGGGDRVLDLHGPTGRRHGRDQERRDVVCAEN